MSYVPPVGRCDELTFSFGHLRSCKLQDLLIFLTETLTETEMDLFGLHGFGGVIDSGSILLFACFCGIRGTEPYFSQSYPSVANQETRIAYYPKGGSFTTDVIPGSSRSDALSAHPHIIIPPQLTA